MDSCSDLHISFYKLSPCVFTQSYATECQVQTPYQFERPQKQMQKLFFKSVSLRKGENILKKILLALIYSALNKSM